MKKVMLCIDLNDESFNLMKDKVSSLNLEKGDELHLVHGFQLQVYSDTFFVSSFPQKDQYEPIEQSVHEALKGLEDLINKNYDGVSVHKKCMFTTSPKNGLVKYAEENSIEEMVIGTRGKHGIEGLFSSSFAEFMIRHAPCELRIFRL